MFDSHGKAMAEMTVSKTVFFIGAWRTTSVTDNLLKQISSQLATKKGYSTTLTLTSGGLELLIHDKSGKVTRTDKIPLQNIIDFIGNKYSSTCILAIVKDRQNQFTVFVFLCSSERDAGDMVQTFSVIKKRLSGEGYNLHLTPKGTNWMLKQKAESDTGNVQNVRTVVVENTEKIRINGDNTTGRVGEVRVLANGDVRHVVSDNVSHESAGSEIKDELLHLSDEVKAIKLMLEKNQPQYVNQEQLHEYRVIHSPGIKGQVVQGHVVQGETVQGQVVQGQVVQEQVIQEPYYQNTTYQTTNPGESNVIYHYETMANQPTIKTQTIYTKNQRYGSRREHEPGGFYVMRGRTDTGHSKARSNLSLAHSTKSYYTKRHYDSPNPMLDKNMTTKQVKAKYPATMKVMTTTTEPKGVYRKRALYKTVSSDIVRKNIEDVYKNRSFRKHMVPVIINPRATEYIQTAEVSPTTKQNQVQVMVSPPPEVHVKPVQREVVEEIIETKEISDKGNALVVDYENTGLQQTEQVVDYGGQVFNTADYENLQIIESGVQEQRVYTVESTEGQYRNDADTQQTTLVEGGGDVIVIKAETLGDTNTQSGYTIRQDSGGQSSYRITQEPEVSTDAYQVTYANQGADDADENVIHIKAESAGQVRYVRDYKQVEVIDTRDIEDQSGEERNGENGESSRNSAHVIIREEHMKPPSEIRDSLEIAGEYNGEVRRITSNGKRVHYMEELHQNINDRRDSDDEIHINAVNINGDDDDVIKTHDNNNDDKEEDAEVKYIMNTERLQEYTKEPNIVIVEQEVNVSGGKVVENYHQNIISADDLQRAEDTVLF